MDVFDGRRPEIEYPCRWSYRVIGTSDDEIRALLVEIVGSAEHVIEASNASRKGTYVSLHLSVTVDDEDHRLRIYQGISTAECVKMVL